MRETYLDGMSEDPEVPFSRQRSVLPAAGSNGPTVRKVKSIAPVFDITGMIKELESNPDARRRPERGR